MESCAYRNIQCFEPLLIPSTIFGGSLAVTSLAIFFYFLCLFYYGNLSYNSQRLDYRYIEDYPHFSKDGVGNVRKGTTGFFLGLGMIYGSIQEYTWN